MADERGKIRDRVSKEIEAFLRSLGSTTSEVKVFVVLSKAKKYLSIKEIEQMVDLSSKSIRNALKRLESKGFIKVREKEGKKVYRAVSVKEIIEEWKKKVEETLSHVFKRP